MNWQDKQYLDTQFKAFTNKINALSVQLVAIKNQGDTIMGLAEDIQAKIDAANTSLASLKADFTTEIANLKQQIVTLSNGQITPDQATQLLANLDALTAGIGDLDTQAKAG